MRCAAILVVFAVAWPSEGLPQQKQKVFVTNMRAPQLDTATRAALFDLIVVAANRAGTVDVVTIDDIDQELAQEKRKDAVACSTMTCAVELSGALGVRYLLTSRAEKLADEILVTVSLIDTVEQRSVTGQGRGLAAKAETLGKAVDAAVAEALGVMRVDLFDPRTNVCKVGEAPGPDCAGQCGKGVGDSCAALGRAYWDGTGTITRDPDKAREYMQRACNAKSAAGCVDLGRLLSRMPPSRLDKGRAADAFKKACDMGDATGCGYLAAAYRQGFGVKVDIAKARALADPACAAADGHGVGCAVLGRMILGSEGSVRDVARASDAFRRGCDQGNAAACAWLGEAHIEHGALARDDARAAEYFRRGCGGVISNRDSGACTGLGDLYIKGRGGFKVDIEQGAQLYAMACESDANPGTACAWLGFHYLRGTLVAIDETRGIHDLMRACDFENAEACAELKSLCDGDRLKEACR